MDLVFHHAALGDFALLLPIIRGTHRPMTVIAPWARSMLAAQLFGHVRPMDIDMFEFTRLHSDAGPSSVSPAVKDLFESADRIISFIASADDPWTANVAKLAPQAALAHVKARPPRDFAGTVLDFYVKQLADQDIDITPRIEPDEAFGTPTGPVLIHPGSGGVDKCWPRSRFVELLDRLAQRNVPARVLIGEAEIDRWGNEQVQQWVEDHDVVVCTMLEMLVQAMEAGSVYLGNDAGPTHLAAQMGLPTVAMFGPTSPTTWQPRGPHVTLLAPPEPAPMTWLDVRSVEHALVNARPAG